MLFAFFCDVVQSIKFHGTCPALLCGIPSLLYIWFEPVCCCVCVNSGIVSASPASYLAT